MNRKLCSGLIAGLFVTGFLYFMFVSKSMNMAPTRDMASFATFADVNSSPRSSSEDEASRTCAQVNLKKYSIQIESEFTINRLRNWNGIFQTDIGNRGIRLEIDEKGSSGLLFPVTDEPKMSAIVFKDESIRVGVENKFSAVITLTNKLHVRAQLNGELQKESFPYSEIGCQLLISGGGFDVFRNLDGISHTEISLVQLSDNEKLGISYTTQKLLSVVFIALLFVSLLVALTRRDEAF